MGLTISYLAPGTPVVMTRAANYLASPAAGPARSDITISQGGSYTSSDGKGGTIYNIVLVVTGVANTPGKTDGTYIDTANTAITAPACEGFSVRSGDSTRYGNLTSSFLLSYSGVGGWPASCQVQVGVKNQGAGQNTVYVFSKGVAEDDE